MGAGGCNAPGYPTVHGEGFASDSLRGSIYLALAAIAGVVVLKAPHLAHGIATLIVGLTATFCASYAVSFILWSMAGPGTFEIFRAAVPQYPWAGPQPIFFPFSPTFSFSVIGQFQVPRLTGYMREPGLFQAVATFCFFAAPRLNLKRPRLIQGLLLIGLIATFSTAGLGVFLATAVLSFATRSREVDESVEQRTVRSLRAWRVAVSAALFVLAGYLAIAAPVIGLRDKSVSAASDSVSERSNGALDGLSAILNSPLGSNGGIGEDPTTLSTVSINLIASTVRDGVPGLALGVMIFLLPVMLATNWPRTLVLVLPLFLTALLAQPVTGSPSFILLLLVALALDKPLVSGRGAVA